VHRTFQILSTSRRGGAGMPEQLTQPGGFSYTVSAEQLQAFARMTDLERLQWVEDARLFTLLGRTPQTAELQERLRRGERSGQLPG